MADTTIEGGLRLFCAKCIGLPIAAVPHTSIKIIGAVPGDFTTLDEYDWNTHYHLSEDPFLYSKLAESLPLVISDLHLLAADTRRVWVNHASKERKVAVVLRAIGRPAHFTEIIAIYESMFPGERTKVHNVHILLSRKRHGVIWAGYRGIYALNEWRETDQSAYQKFAKRDTGNREETV